MKKMILRAIAGSIAVASMSANAVSLFQSDTYINLGTNVYDEFASPPLFVDGDFTTANITEFGFIQFLATSVYSLADGSVLGSFYDSNDPTVLGNLGIPTGDLLAMDGLTTRSFTLPTATQVDFDALAPIAPGNPSADDNEGYALSWRMVAQYTLYGDLAAGGPTYTGGTIDIYFEELVDLAGPGGVGAPNSVNDKEKVLTLTLTGSQVNLANLDLFFNVTFAKDNFFFVKDESTGVFKDAADGGVTATLDTNVNPPIPTADQLLMLTDNNNGGSSVAVRQTTLDGTIGYRVPEPATLGLFGLGLLGLGATMRRRATRS